MGRLQGLGMWHFASSRVTDTLLPSFHLCVSSNERLWKPQPSGWVCECSSSHTSCPCGQNHYIFAPEEKSIFSHVEVILLFVRVVFVAVRTKKGSVTKVWPSRLVQMCCNNGSQSGSCRNRIRWLKWIHLSFCLSFCRVPSRPAWRPQPSLRGRGLGSPARSRISPTPPLPAPYPFPTGAKMATGGAPRLSLPLLLPVTTLLLSLLLTSSHALCKYQHISYTLLMYIRYWVRNKGKVGSL